mmetsp:Transcript_6118/g.18099  ORF Transcript_6118/g.18099 Transcript_6118/m.18099 type:complete len:763 (+) Transcript_6118:221-2509(+)
MMRRAVALLALACANALYEDDEHVTQFTDPAALQEAVLDDDASVWVIHFYHGDADKDGQSPAVADAFGETTAELLDGLGVKAGCVDVADQGMQKLLQRLSIVGVPSFIGFGAEKAKNPYTKKTDRPAVRFPPDSGFSKTSFKRWVSGKVMPTDAVERVTDASDLTALGPSAILLTERITTSALAKSLGVALRGRLAVAEVLVDKSPTPLAAALAGDAPTLPTLLASKNAYAAGAALDEYDGDLKDREAVLKWLEGYASKERKAKEPKKDKKEPAAPGGWPKEFDLLKVADDASFQETVLQNEAAVLTFRKGADVPFVGKIMELDGAGAVDAVEVDCASAKAAPVCAGDAPYAAYPHGAAAKAKHAAAPEKDGLAAFAAAASTLPADDVTRVGTPMEMDNFLRLAVTGVEQDEAPLGIVVFTSKDDISPTTRALGATLGRHAGVKVGQWSAPPLEAVADFGVKKLPAVVAFYSVELDPNTPMMERGMQAAPYDRRNFGPPNFQGMVMFANSVLAQIHPATAGELQDGLRDAARTAVGARTDSKGPAAAKGPVFQSLNSDDAWTARCGPDAASALCAVALLDQHGRPEKFADELGVAEAVAKAEQPSPFAFGWVDAACHADFAAAFDVYESGLPTVVAYAPKKERYATLVGRYSAADVKAFLRGVVSGRVATAPLRSSLSPPAADVDCAAAHAAKFAPADEDGLDDDFMAELLAEEAAAKKALEEEAAAESKRLKDELKASKTTTTKAPKKKKKKSKKKKQSEL